MSQYPVNHEVGATLAAFFIGGSGPTHATLTRVFERTGYGDVAPYAHPDVTPTKEARVRDVLMAAEQRPSRSREMVERLLAEMRADGCFRPSSDSEYDRRRKFMVRDLQEAFRRIDWALTDEGELLPGHGIAVTPSNDRPAIEEQLQRLRRSTDDPALLLGTAKEMLESTAKYVLEQFDVPYGGDADFGHLWYLARERLGINPKDVATATEGGKQVQKIYGAIWTIAEQVNELRSKEGTGHGRTLPTGVSPELAMLVVREACSVTEFVLRSLDRQFGR